MNFRLRLLTAFGMAGLLGLSTDSFADVSMHNGRYLGYLDPSGGARKLALTMDLFVVKPNDRLAFPKQNALLKVSLGGLHGQEYVTEFYDDIHFDFAGGTITMGGPGNDISFTGQVSGSDQSKIQGQAFIRSAALTGSITLQEFADDPDAEPGTLPSDQYKSLLAGQYTGHCAGAPAVMQIETARGLDPTVDAEHQGLAPYRIVGRLGMHHEEALCSAPILCAMRNYLSGQFDPFRSRLILKAETGTDLCQVTDTGLSCVVNLGTTTPRCDLRREDTPASNGRFYHRSENLRPTPAQRLTLPEPSPPSNAALIAAVRGTYTGYLHHEASNLYQAMRLNVMAFTATDNPHNNNLVSIAGAAVLYFGQPASDDFFVQQFEPRSFYLVPGFTLESPGADAFLQVIEWRQGYLRGIWYSRAFGRVGTFQLLKGDEFPVLSARAAFVPSIAGEYVGPDAGTSLAPDRWWVNLIVPTQQAVATTSTLSFVGQSQVSSRSLPPRGIMHGAYDFYSGAVAWEAMDGRVISGQVSADATLNLFWPSGAPLWGVLVGPDHIYRPYGRPHEF